MTFMEIITGLKTFFEKLMSFMHLDTWVIQVFVIVFLALLLSFIAKRVLIRLREAARKTRSNWDDAVFESLRSPLSLFIWVLGFALAANVVGKETDAAIFSAVPTLRTVGVIFCIAWFLFKFIYNVEENIINSKREADPSYDRTTADAIAKLLRVSVVITAFLVALQSLGYSISGVLAFGGIGGIAVGFAARDLLANFFGGLMIYLDRPFSVGDWIRSPDRDIEGTVEVIGWRLTVIRTFDKRPLYLPNSIFNTIAVENPSRMSNRRIYETIGIRYADAAKMAVIVNDVKQMLQSHEEIDTDKTLIVNFNKFAASSLDFFIYAYTKTTDWVKYHEVKQDVLLRIIGIIEGQGAECAFPTSTVHIPEGVRVEQN